VKFNLINRRTHLYLGLFFLPWILMYGLSSVPFSHNMNKLFDDGGPQWTDRFERPFSRPLPAQAEMREFAAAILEELGLEGAFGTYMPNPKRLNIYMPDFISPAQVIYYVDEQRLVVRDKRFRLDHFLTGMHARGGYQHDSLLNDAWALIVDIVCLGMVLWVISGIIIWWQMGQARFWGKVCLAGGALSFVCFLLAL